MYHLLITPVLLIILSFLVTNKDIKVVSRLLSCILLFDFITLDIPDSFFYAKYCLLDLAMLLSGFSLTSKINRLVVVIACFISSCLNFYEMISYYQTIFYQYRTLLQFSLMQIMIFGLIYKCQWREFWKTNTQK